MVMDMMVTQGAKFWKICGKEGITRDDAVEFAGEVMKELRITSRGLARTRRGEGEGTMALDFGFMSWNYLGRAAYSNGVTARDRTTGSVLTSFESIMAAAHACNILRSSFGSH